MTLRVWWGWRLMVALGNEAVTRIAERLMGCGTLGVASRVRIIPRGDLYFSWGQRVETKRGLCEKFEFGRELGEHGMWFPESRIENVFRKDRTWVSQRRQGAKLSNICSKGNTISGAQTGQRDARHGKSSWLKYYVTLPFQRERSFCWSWAWGD